MRMNKVLLNTGLAVVFGFTVGAAGIGHTQTYNQAGTPPPDHAKTISGQQRSPHLESGPTGAAVKPRRYAPNPASAGTPPPDHAKTISGQQRSPNLESGPTGAAVSPTRYAPNPESAGTPPPPRGTTLSGQHRAPMLESGPTGAAAIRGGQPAPTAGVATGTGTQVPAQRYASAGNCTEQATGVVPLSETGQPATRALNILMASGCTQFENFREHGNQWAANVETRRGGEQTAVIDPETGSINFVGG